MTARRNAWITHAIIVTLLLVTVGVWAILIARADRGSWDIGRAIGIVGFGATVVYSILATTAVALWGHRPLRVFGLHALCLLATALLVTRACIGHA